MGKNHNKEVQGSEGISNCILELEIGVDTLGGTTRSQPAKCAISGQPGWLSERCLPPEAGILVCFLSYKYKHIQQKNAPKCRD